MSAGKTLCKTQSTDISLISEGFACRYKLLDDGRRQITALLIPGDICDLRPLVLHRMDQAVAALTACQISVIPHRKLLEMIERHPGLGFAPWADTMLDGAIYARWLTNIGRLPAHARIAHLLCELSIRLQAVGRAEHGIELPLTQTDIGDAMGLSTVHVNRTLQRLRAEGSSVCVPTSLSCAIGSVCAPVPSSIQAIFFASTMDGFLRARWTAADTRTSLSLVPHLAERHGRVGYFT